MFEWTRQTRSRNTTVNGVRDGVLAPAAVAGLQARLLLIGQLAAPSPIDMLEELGTQVCSSS